MANRQGSGIGKITVQLACNYKRNLAVNVGIERTANFAGQAVRAQLLVSFPS
jgi:hypothetical protein